jgi:hypothetical protein
MGSALPNNKVTPTRVERFDISLCVTDMEKQDQAKVLVFDNDNLENVAANGRSSPSLCPKIITSGSYVYFQILSIANITTDPVLTYLHTLFTGSLRILSRRPLKQQAGGLAFEHETSEALSRSSILSRPLHEETCITPEPSSTARS